MNGNDERWSIYSASQHLPAVLTDPNKGKQANFFTKTWGDTFVEKTTIEKSPFLPEITWAHFDNYLNKYGRRYKIHSRLKEIKCENNHKKIQTHTVNTEGIPEIYLRPSLNLHDPKVFQEVFQTKKTEHELQDELSFHLDLVEEQIAQQVSQKSGAFFHAMTSHDSIMEQMGIALEEVKILRSKVHRVDRALARESLRLIGLSRSKTNHAALLDKLKLMATVLQTQPTLQLLLSSSDYVGALELISGTQEVLAKELAGVTSLRHLPSQLKEMQKLIDKMLSTEFERYAAADLHRPLDIEIIGVLEPERLVSLVAGLLRQNHLQFLEVYKQEAVTAAQALLKQLMIEQLADAEDELNELTGSGEIAPVMDAANWLKVIRSASEALTKIIERVKAVCDVIRETAASSAGLSVSESSITSASTEHFLTLEENNRVELKLRDLLGSVCDYCNERIASLVSTRSDKQTVTAVQVNELSSVVEGFTEMCERTCGGRQSAALKAAFKIQAGNYVHKFHTQRKNKLQMLLDAESWKVAEVPLEIQMLVDKLASGEPIKSLPCSPTEEDISTDRYTTKPSPYLKVGTQKFYTVGALLILIRLISEYCVCSYDLQLLAPVVARNLTELLKTYNSRSCQLVLGAGALRTAGLKTITSTNLALGSRSLQFLIWLIPLLRAHFKYLTNEVSNGFDLVEKDISHHIRHLETKVLSIMNTLLGEQLNEWDAKPPVPSKQFRNISRHLTKLHEAVSAVLPQEQVTDIYEVIHKNFKNRLRDQLTKLNIQNNGGPQHGVVTTETIFYLETMKTLKVLPEKYLSDSAMDDIWTK
ncbi:vacuolar protein sorting-associated protein 54 [Diorhabda sublineata]|uniref:vacuolar protein sorting-associated protein 54 n=1 Tax=Diorhabda sublineata TaxID=1163346 RepID=UPI0024E17ACD|nr:vacuolar protein sorting-associated protein 54 [Diorhabda sublineata]